MSLTAQVIVTANLQQITGSLDAASAVFELEGFGNTVPRVPGTTIIVQTATTAVADGSGNISVTLWGLDVITPAGCFYTVTFYNDAGGFVATLAYDAFVGSGTFDLSTVTPKGETVVAAQAPNAAVPQVLAASPHQFLTGMNSTGLFTTARPAAADLSDTATTGNVLRGNGTSFISATLAASDLSNTTTGTGAVVLASGATLIDPLINTLNVTGNSGLGTTGTGGQIAGGFASPCSIRHYIGDGTGWQIQFAKRVASVDTVQAWLNDSGILNVVTGFQVGGGGTSGSVLRGNGTNYVPATLAAADLSNGVSGSGAVVLATSPTLVTPTLGVATATSLTTGTVVGPASAAVNIRGGSGTTFAMAVQNTTGATNLFIVDNTGNITSVSSFAVTSAGVITGAAVKLAGTVTATIQNDGGGNVQIGTSATQPSLSVGANPFSAFSINPGTALVSNPTSGQARRGMTFANDPAGDVTLWYNSAQTGAGYFFKDGNGGSVMTVPTGSGTLVARATTDTLTNKTIGTGGLGGLTVGHQIFTSSGTFTIPAGVTNIKVTVTGGGGGGTGATTVSGSSGNGGYAGATAIKWLTGLTPGNTLTVTVGTGGAGVAAATTGGAGVASSVASGTQTISTITANGGVANSTSTLAAATASGGDINTLGGTILPSQSSSFLGGFGASSFWGSGPQGGSQAAGTNATTPGTGGSGGGGAAATAVNGGNGAAGIVLVEWHA